MSLGSFLPSQNVAGIWHLDNSSVDSTPQANTGTDTDMTYGSAFGKIGGGGLFNGTSSKIVLPSNAFTQPAASFSIFAWINTITDARQIFNNRSVNTDRAGFSLEIGADTANKVSLQSGNNTGTSLGTNWQRAEGLTSINDGKWHWVGGVYDEVNLNVYIDSKLDAQVAWANDPAYAATNYVRIGCDNASGTDSAFFLGNIDEVLLMNVALNGTQIKRMYEWSLGKFSSIA